MSESRFSLGQPVTGSCPSSPAVSGGIPVVHGKRNVASVAQRREALLDLLVRRTGMAHEDALDGEMVYEPAELLDLLQLLPGFHRPPSLDLQRLDLGRRVGGLRAIRQAWRRIAEGGRRREVAGAVRLHAFAPVRRHLTPSLPSSSSMPRSASWRRMASAAAKSLRARASL